jgi:O-antigen ligase
VKKTIENLLKFCVYLTFFVPLIVMPNSFIFPFIVPKVLALRSLILIAGGLYAVLLITNWKEYKPRLTSVMIMVALFMVSFGMSTIFGVDPYHSFWDNHERMLGFFTLLHYGLYFFICTSIFKTWGDFQKSLKVFVCAGSLVMLVAVLQFINPDFLLNQGAERKIATLGNSIYVGGYGLFLIAASLLLYAKESDKKLKWLWMAASILALGGGVLASGSRGAFIGVVVGVLISGCIYAAVLRKKYSWGYKILLAGFVVGIIVTGTLFHYRYSTFVERIPAVGRVLNTSWVELTTSPRSIAWSIAVEGWKERSILGWGPNNYFYLFDKYYHPQSLEYGYGETWFDNAHNIILNTLAVQGVVGLVVYLGIFVAAFVSLVKAFRKQYIDVHIMSIGIGFLVGSLIQNITVFENPTSYLYTMFWLALISSLVFNHATVEKNTSTKKIGWGLLGGVGVVVIFGIVIFNLQPARANSMTLKILQSLDGGHPAESFAAIEEALAFPSPHIDDIRTDIARNLITIVTNKIQAQNLKPEDRDRLFVLINTILDKNIILHPLDSRNYATKAQVLQAHFAFSQQAADLVEADKYMDKGLALSPRRQQYIYQATFLKYQNGKQDEAIRMLQQTLQDDPNIGESYWRLAFIYSSLKQMDKANALFEDARAHHIKFSSDDQNIWREILATTSLQFN